MERTDLIWYVAYGSNMLEERFMVYINGGKFRDIPKVYKMCSDTEPPKTIMLYELPYNMYFGNNSQWWGNMGVSFLDISSPEKAYGIAYLISQVQFDHLYLEENGGHKPKPESTWYNCKFCLGSFDDISVMTFTNSRDELIEKNDAGDKYKGILCKGLKENYNYLSDEEIKTIFQIAIGLN